jgi:hypothetical protein
MTTQTPTRSRAVLVAVEGSHQQTTYQQPEDGAYTLTIEADLANDLGDEITLTIESGDQLNADGTEHIKLQDVLLAYSEWLDSEGAILPEGVDSRSHDDLAQAFIREIGDNGSPIGDRVSAWS